MSNQEIAARLNASNRAAYFYVSGDQIAVEFSNLGETYFWTRERALELIARA